MKKEISCLVWGITEDVRWQEVEVEWWPSFEQMCKDKYNSSATEKLKGKEKHLVNEENKWEDKTKEKQEQEKEKDRKGKQHSGEVQERWRAESETENGMKLE